MRDLADHLLPIEEHDDYHFVLDARPPFAFPETLTALKELGPKVAVLNTGYMDDEMSEEVAVLQLRQVLDKACLAAEKAMGPNASRGR